MSKPLRVLFVQDSEADAEVIAGELRRGGFDPSYERVDTQASFQAALQWKTWDVIIADYKLPRFNGLMALGIARETGLDIPFILVPGTIGEGLAVTAMKAGAQDYVLKDQLARLPAAVEREVREARVRRRKRETELALERSHRAFRQVIDSAPDGVAVVRDGEIVYANLALARCFGYASGIDMVGLDPSELLRAEDRDANREHLKALLDEKRGEPPRQHQALRKDGTSIVMEISTGYLEDFEGSPALILFVRDVTLRVQMEAQMMMTERVVATARLATGAAIDLSNPLAYMALNTQFLREELEKHKGVLPPDAARELREALVEVDQGASRMRELVMTLRSVARADTARTEPVEIARVLETASNLAVTEQSGSVRIVRNVPASLMVRANAGSLLQLLFTLLGKLAQGIGADGSPAPDGSPRNAGPPTITIAGRAVDSARVSLEIRDDAPAPPELVSALFDTDFLARQPIGSASGLAVCKQMVDAMGGTIDARAESPAGKCITVVLPGAESPAEPAKPEVRHTPRPRKARLLVVDDEPMVTWSVRRVLGKDWDVVVASSGPEALRAIQNGGRFEAIVCDLLMPEMTGMEVYARVRDIDASLADRIIFLTGGAFTVDVERFLSGLQNARLDKPVQMDELRAQVARVTEEA
jgi:PAS domain S-box-containing protein